jgi:RQC domain
MLVGQLDDLPPPLTRLSTTGLLRDQDPQTIERWIDAISAAGLVRSSDDQYRTLGLTPLGRDVMAGRVEDTQISAPVRRVRSRRRTPFQRLVKLVRPKR